MFRGEVGYTPFTRYNLLSNRFDNRFDNRLCRVNGALEFNFPFQHKYGYIRDDVSWLAKKAENFGVSNKVSEGKCL